MILEDFFEGKIVRDDIYPFPGGGNKGRKALFYEKELLENGYNAIVTTGGIQSNHCRAMAIIAAKNGWRCHIVYHGSKARFIEEKGNALLTRLTPATFEFVDAEGISDAMDKAMSRFIKDGFKPYYVTGGGHDIPGGMAYVEAIAHLVNEATLINWKPEVIFHATGTGSTQAGIIAGLEKYGWGDVDVIGISIARTKERGANIVNEFLHVLTNKLGLKDLSNKIIFRDDFLYGGYEKYSEEMYTWLVQIMKQTGIFFDTTYSGKALWGMYNIVKNEYRPNNALFWHTGGIMNLMR